MRALSIVGERAVEVVDKPDPEPGPGELLIEMQASAICGSDLHIYRSPRPAFIDNAITPGHEGCGTVAAVGEGVEGWSVGDRAVVYFRRTCGACRYCITGNNHVCAIIRPGYGFGAGGSDAEFMTSDASATMRLPDDISFRDGSILACQGGTAFAPLVRLGAGGLDRIAVSGLGPVGLLATQFAIAMGAEVIGIDPVASRRNLAAELGAAVTLDPTAGEIGAAIKAHWPDGADKLVETSGATPAHEAICSIVRPLGTAALVGLGNPIFQTSLNEITRWEITVFGSTIYPMSQWDTLCDFVRRKQIDLGAIVSEDLSIEEGARGFQLADDAASGKICFHFDR